MHPKNLLNFFFELGHMRRIKHEGWRLAGVQDPESVADHSLRAAQIGYFLAKMEKCESLHEVVTMLVFHDCGECRVGDIHKVANRYIQADEEGAVKDQMISLDGNGDELLEFWREFENKSSLIGIIAKDADYLEQAITAKEYIVLGHDCAEDWITNIGKSLQTESAKLLFKSLNEVNPNDWWQGLKKL